MKQVALSIAVSALLGAASLHAGSWTPPSVPRQVQTYKSVLTPNHMGVVNLNGTLYACDLELPSCAAGIELAEQALIAGRSLNLNIHSTATIPGQWDGGSVTQFKLIEGFSLNY